MRETQLDAWDTLQSSIIDKRARVFSVIKGSERGVSMFQVAEILGWPINRVSGRITELCNKGLVEDSGRRMVNPQSGKRVIVWRVAS